MGVTWHTAWSNIMAAKMRSFLAILGVLVGTASVVAMVSCVQLATDMALRQFETLGTHLITTTILPNKTLLQFDRQTLATVQQDVPSIRHATPYAVLYDPVYAEGRSLRVTTFVATAAIQAIAQLKLRAGRFFSDLDRDQRYCVVGAKVFTGWPRQPQVGQRLQIGEHVFTIIGVLKSWSQNPFLAQDIDRSLLVNLEAGQVINPSLVLRDMIAKFEPTVTVGVAEQQLRQAFSTLFPDTRILYHNAERLLQNMQRQGQILALMLGLVGSIALVVGGLGIMNVMLATLHERRREIGIRMAIGASPRDIERLFLLESTLVAVCGGIVGIVLGLAMTFVIAKYVGWVFQWRLKPIIMGFVVSTSTGIFFGYYPARRAARLTPVEALRVEL